MTVDAALVALRAALAKDAARALPTVELRFVGDPRRFTLDCAHASLVEGAAPGVCSIGLVPDDVDDLLAKKTTLGALFSTGRLRVLAGNIGDAMKLGALFS